VLVLVGVLSLVVLNLIVLSFEWFSFELGLAKNPKLINSKLKALLFLKTLLFKNERCYVEV
jgi:hypothetical protein